MSKVTELLTKIYECKNLIEGLDDSDDSDGLSQAERELSKLGTKLSKRQSRLLQRADVRDEDKSVRRVKQEDGSEEEEDDDGLTPAERELASKGQALSKRQSRLLQRADVRDEDKSVRRVKQEDGSEEEEKSSGNVSTPLKKMFDKIRKKTAVKGSEEEETEEGNETSTEAGTSEDEENEANKNAKPGEASVPKNELAESIDWFKKSAGVNLL